MEVYDVDVNMMGSEEYPENIHGYVIFQLGRGSITCATLSQSDDTDVKMFTPVLNPHAEGVPALNYLPQDLEPDNIYVFRCEGNYDESHDKLSYNINLGTHCQVMSCTGISSTLGDGGAYKDMPGVDYLYWWIV